MHDLIIIGSGPAGLSAAVYGRRAGFSTLVIEKNPMSGGQVLNTYEVDNYLGLPGINGFDMGMKFREHAEKMQAEFMEADVLGVEDSEDCKLVKTAEGDFEARAVIIASGASHSHLGVPGEEELSGMGVSYCATCDGAFFRGKTVAVIGGGDVAVEDAIFLARACEKVYLIHRRDSLRAAQSLQNTMLALPNVEVCWDSVVESINGDGQVSRAESGGNFLFRAFLSQLVLNPIPKALSPTLHQMKKATLSRVRTAQPVCPAYLPQAISVPRSCARL